MNILIYFGNQLNPQNGGTERVACLLADYLARQGHKVYHVACYKSPDSRCIDSDFLPEQTEAPTVSNVRYVKNFVAEHNIDIIINEGGNGEAIYLFSHSYIPANVRIITHIHFDILGDNRTFYKSLCLPLRNVSVWAFIINLLKWIKAPYNKAVNLSEKKKRYDLLLKNSDSVVVLTKQHIADFKILVHNGDFDKIAALENPIPFADVVSQPLTKRNEILFVGRLDYATKRVDRILKVWAQLQERFGEWSLTIVGDGNDRNRLERISSDLKLKRIRFTGNTDPTPYYESSKLLLLTSNHEGTPMVIPEAMAFGVVPIVMNTFSGASAFITDSFNGILTKPYEIQDMAQKAANLMTDSPSLDLMSRNAVDTIRKIDNNIILSAWNNIISHE